MVCFGNKPRLLPSKQHKEWHKDASLQVSGFTLPKSESYNVIFTYYAPDKRKGDLSNKWESIGDLLVDLGLIEDDNWFVLPKVTMVFGGVDKDNPRAEIEFR